jgi:PTS system cellobiose-specific IIB component
MRVLLICSGGLSSGILGESLTEEAHKQGCDNFHIEAGGADYVALTLQNEHERPDIILVAPQVAFKKAEIEETVKNFNIPVMLIESKYYTPMRAGELYRLIKEKISH